MQLVMLTFLWWKYAFVIIINNWQGLPFNNHHRNNNWADAIETNFIYKTIGVGSDSERALIIKCNSTLTVHRQPQTATANAIVPK